jgi:hypothetical protein
MARRKREGALEMTTTYTVYSPASGTEYGRGLSAIEAADIVLSHDGASYELRHVADYDVGDQKCWQLFVNSASRRGMTECYTGPSGRTKLARAYAANQAEAWARIAEQVVMGCGDWRHTPEVMTDASYDEMRAEVDAE